MKVTKGTFELYNDLFKEEDRHKLPVNYYVLRTNNDGFLKKLQHSFGSSDFYNTNKINVGVYHKSISNIL